MRTGRPDARTCAPRMAGRGAAPLLGLLCLLALPRCKDSYREVKVSFAERVNVSDRRGSGVEGTTLRFGLATRLSPAETVGEYSRVVEGLGAILGRKVRLVHSQSYEHANAMLRGGRIDLAWVCTGGYLDLVKHDPGIEIVAVPQVNGKTTYHSLIVVHGASPVERFTDLRGQRFVFVDPLSQTGYRYPQQLLARLGVDKDRFFSSYIFTGSHDRSITAVIRRAADGAAVDELIFNYLTRVRPAETKGLRILHRSPPFGIPPIVASPRSTAVERTRWRQALLRLHQERSVREHLGVIGVDRFVTPVADQYRALLVDAE